MKNKVSLLVFTMLAVFFNAQVGINTTSPNGATVLDITSNQKGILIPRLSDAERDANLADNDPLTIPPAGIVNGSLATGTLIFNITTNNFQYWDGSLWKQFFVPTSSNAGNDGVVRVNAGNANVKPSINLIASGNAFGPAVTITYTTPLVIPNQ